MKSWTRTLTLALSLGALMAAGACDDDGGTTSADTTDSTDTLAGDTSGGGDTTVADTTDTNATYATLVFTVDDSTNKTYDDTDGLAWKGSFSYDDATNTLTFDGAWGGPFPALYDDGTHGDATAGDNIWTIAAQVATPAEDLEIEYGAIRGSVDGSDGDWIWTGSNGKVTIPAGETGTVTATSLVIEPFGDIDLKLTIDVSGSGANLSALFQGADYTDVKVKGSAWGWREVTMTDDGTKGDDTASDGIYTFIFSENLDKHDGLLKAGDQAQFVFVLDGVEYKDPTPPTTGVQAYLDSGSGFEAATIEVQAEGDKNTYVEPGGGTTTAFTPPADHVAVNFCVDDTANQTYDDTDGLAWKGSFDFNADTRVLAKDGGWGGPFPMLYDDGPWDMGGHEPTGATAGDHNWCVTVWVSNAAAESFEYGLVSGSVEGSDGKWIWTGSNGTFDVAAGATDAIDAAGYTIVAFGNTDLRLTIDISNSGANLNAGFQGVDYTGDVKVKGSAWAWEEVALSDDGTTNGDETGADGIYSFVLSDNLTKHIGKLNSGDKPEFIFVLGGVEYKASSTAATEGVAASLDSNGTFAPATIEINADNGNSFVTVP